MSGWWCGNWLGWFPDEREREREGVEGRDGEREQIEPDRGKINK